MKAYIGFTDGLSGVVDAPSSKNYTTRFLLAAALADGVSVVHRPAASEDADAMMRGLRAYGAGITPIQDGKALEIRGFGGRPGNPGLIDPGNAGAVLRLLMGIGALVGEIRFATRYTDSLGTRPQDDLLDALEQLGCETESEGGCLPVVLRGGPVRGGRVRVRGDLSSQYLSSLLFLGPLLPQGLDIEVHRGLVSRPLVRTTLEVMRRAGIHVEAAPDLLRFRIPGGQQYQAREYWVHGDYPSAAAVLAAAAVTGGRVVVRRLFEDAQGERAVLPVLRSMGADVLYDGRQMQVMGNRGLKATQLDGDRATDMVLAMLGVAACSAGESRFYGIANLRLKECDRISVPARELARLGVRCSEGPGEITVRGCPGGLAGGMELDTHEDHRVAQMLTIVGLRCRDGVCLSRAETVAKSYPGFFRDLIHLGARIRIQQ